MLQPGNLIKQARHLQSKLQNVQLIYALFPVFLVGLYLLVFGFSIPSLGFYWDDWPSIAVLKVFGPKEFFSFFADERPLEGLSYLIFGSLLQSSRIAWQVFALSLRLITVFCMGWTFRLMWPQHRRMITAAALLFAVYPAFIQQPIAVTYHVLWIQYILFFVSLGCMVLSIRNPRRYGLYTSLALITQLLNLVLSEYFYMVEFLRPVLIWLLLADREVGVKKRAIKTLQYWSPYLAVFVLQIVGWLIYRRTHTFVSYDFGERIGRGNTPAAVLEPFLHKPLAALFKIGQIMVQDSMFILATAWFRTFDNQGIEWARRANYLVWAIAILAASGSFFFLSRLKREAGEDVSPGGSSVLPVVVVGGLVVILGALPAWLTNHQINFTSGGFADRFAAVPQFGASLLIAALGAKLLENWKKVALITSILVGLASGYQFRTVLAYRTSWKDQNNFYWQTYWRAPGIKPDTVVVGSGIFLSYNVRSSMSFALNSLLPREQKQKSLNYWMYFVDPNDPPDRLPFKPDADHYHWAYRNLLFTGERPNSIMIYYHPPQTNCYWFLKPEDASLPGLDDKVRRALEFTSPDRIERRPSEKKGPPIEIFGAEPKHAWCYYFQKADLARQYKDWQQVAQLGNEAEQAGLTVHNHTINAAYEWMPFIEGYARTGNWNRAEEISQVAYQKDPAFQAQLCRLWKNLRQTTEQDQASINAAVSIQSALKCP